MNFRSIELCFDAFGLFRGQFATLTLTLYEVGCRVHYWVESALTALERSFKARFVNLFYNIMAQYARVYSTCLGNSPRIKVSIQSSYVVTIKFFNYDAAFL